MRGAIGNEAHVIPFTARVSLQRSSYTIAHRALEPSGQQKLAGINGPVVSPDGRAIAFTAMGDLWLLPAGQQPVQLTNDAAMDIDPAWSPDSTRIAFASDRGGKMDLWLRDLRDNSLSQLTKERGRVSGPAWSPDGNHIAFLIDHRALAAIDLRRDAHRYAFDTSAHGELGRPTWSDDSESIAVGALLPYSNRYREGLNQLLLYSANSSGVSSSVIFPEHSAGNRQDTGPVWSPDGFRMAFVSEGTLWVVPVDRARRRHCAAATRSPRINPSRPAGKAIRGTSSTRRREVCAASSPTAACPIPFRSISPGVTPQRPSASSSMQDMCSTAHWKRCAASRTS